MMGFTGESETIEEATGTLYKATKGFQYHYQYLFDQASVWNHPIDHVLITFAVDQSNVKKVLTEKEFGTYIEDNRERCDRSAGSFFLFDNNAKRKTLLLEGVADESNKLCFTFERQNWEPDRNPGVSFLGKTSPGGEEAVEFPSKEKLEEWSQKDKLSVNDIEDLFEITFPFFPLTLQSPKQYEKENCMKILLAQDLLVKHGDQSCKYLREILEQADEKKALYAWTLLARIGYMEDAAYFDDLYASLGEEEKLLLAKWFCLLGEYDMKGPSGYYNIKGDYYDYHKVLDLLKIRKIPQYLREKIEKTMLSDSSVSIKKEIFVYFYQPIYEFGKNIFQI